MMGLEELKKEFLIIYTILPLKSGLGSLHSVGKLTRDWQIFLFFPDLRWFFIRRR